MAHLRNPNEIQQEQNPRDLRDALCCNEEHYLDQESMEEEEQSPYCDNNKIAPKSSPDPIPLPENHLFSEEEELEFLLSKEEEGEEGGGTNPYGRIGENPSFIRARSEGVEWMLKVSEHYGFSAVTAVLAVNYLDRFLLSFSRSDHRREEKPWMAQLAAVACISLAAKVEEIHVPLLLDLQVGDAQFVFEAKTIQRMEILVLSTLQWKMNPVTPISFLAYIARGIGLKEGLICWEFPFLRSCERLLMILVSDSRFPRFPPSVTAMATALQVMEGLVEPCISMDYQNRFLCFPNIDKDKVRECGDLIKELVKRTQSQLQFNKRKLRSTAAPPRSPSGVIDASFSSDSSNDSWATSSSSSPSSSVSSSLEPLSKKNRGTSQEDQNLFAFHRGPSSSADFLTVPPR